MSEAVDQEMYVIKRDGNEEIISFDKILRPVSYTHLTLPTTPYV